MRTRRRLLLEALSGRQLLAADIALTDSVQDGGTGIVSEFQTSVIVSDSDAITAAGLGSLLRDIFSQPRLSTINQSEAFDGVLYTVGRGNDVDRAASYVATDLATGSSMRFDLVSLAGNLNNGMVKDVGLYDGNVAFVGSSQYLNAPLSGSAPSLWRADGMPREMLLPGPNRNGTIFAIGSGNRVAGVDNFGSDAYVETPNGAFLLPENNVFDSSVVLDLTGNWAVGALNGAAAWKVIGDPANGQYAEAHRDWELVPGGQGVIQMYLAVENGSEAYGFGVMLDGDGDRRGGVWSLNDGSLITEFGKGSNIMDALTLNSSVFTAVNTLSGASIHVLNGGTFDLAEKLGIDSEVFVTPGGLFTHTIDGKTVLGISYTENGATKAAMFEVVAPIYTASFDFDSDGVIDEVIEGTLPIETFFTPTELGTQEVSVTLTGPEGTQNVSEQIEVVPFALDNGVLKVGGTSAADSAILEVLEDGSLKATVNGITEQFEGVDSIIANLGDGVDSLSIDGALVLSLSDVSGVETLNLNPDVVITITDVTAEAVAKARGALVINAGPRHVIEFSDEWEHEDTSQQDGVVTHTLRAGENRIYVRDGVLRNPVNVHDVDLSGSTPPLDALIIVNELNRAGDGSTSPDRLMDVNGDGRLTPLDALRIINHLNRGGDSEGEAGMIVYGPLERKSLRLLVNDFDQLRYESERLSD